MPARTFRKGLLCFPDEDKPEQKEVDGDGDHHHEDRRQPLADARPQEKMEQADFQQVIDNMAAGKARCIAFRGPSSESEVGGQPIVADEPHAVTRRIGKGRIGEEQAETVDAVMDERTERTRYAETEHTPEVLLPPLPQFLDVLYCHG